MKMWVMVVLMMVVVVGAEPVHIEDKDSEDSEETLYEEETGNPEGAPLSDLTSVSPQSSWKIFRKNSYKDVNQRSRGSRRSTKQGPPGPPGPPGPAGPPGSPGSDPQVIQELQQRLREIGGACSPCDRPQVSAFFFRRLLQPIIIQRRSLLELHDFGEASDFGHSQRDRGFQSSSGRFTASKSGFYQVTCSLLIESGDRLQLRLRDRVKASVCVQSLCHNNLSVESVTSIAVAGGTFTVLLTGTLYLQSGQYISVFVDNGTSSSISVQQDSWFSGILLGV